MNCIFCCLPVISTQVSHRHLRLTAFKIWALILFPPPQTCISFISLFSKFQLLPVGWLSHMHSLQEPPISTSSWPLGLTSSNLVHHQCHQKPLLPSLCCSPTSLLPVHKIWWSSFSCQFLCKYYFASNLLPPLLQNSPTYFSNFSSTVQCKRLSCISVLYSLDASSPPFPQ